MLVVVLGDGRAYTKLAAQKVMSTVVQMLKSFVSLCNFHSVDGYVIISYTLGERNKRTLLFTLLTAMFTNLADGNVSIT